MCLVVPRVVKLILLWCVRSGFTPIHLAAKCGHADVFDLFAQTGVSLKHPSSKIGMTALHIASYFGQYEIK